MSQLAGNLDALRNRHPLLAGLLADCRPDPARYRLLPARGQAFSLEVVEPSGKSVLWHSRYDPLREAEREVAALDHSRIYVPFVAGIGLGYTLRLLWDRHRGEFYNAILLEKDPCIFRLALETTRLSDILADPRVSIHVGEDWSAWTDLVRETIPGIMSSSPQMLLHSASRQVHADFYRQAFGLLDDRIRIARAEFDLMIRSGPRIQENLWRNLPAIAASTGLETLRGCIRGRPAVVVAAGPSLDKNVHHLRAYQERITLIAVDTAYRTLKVNGIDPHFVVATDPTELNLKHFEEISPAPETCLVFDPEVYSEIPLRWRHRRIFVNLEKSEFTRWVETVLGPFGFLPKGGSVGHTAFFFACELGADPILFAGLDLAFDPEGGTTHTQASSLKRRHDPFRSGSQTALLGPRFGSDTIRENIVWVPGTRYPSVPTSQIMAIYIQQFADRIAAANVRVIDATEGGARIPGTEEMPLAEALRLFAPAEPPGQNPFESLPIQTGDTERFQQDFARILHALQSGKAVAERGLELTQRLADRVAEGPPLRDSTEWREMEDSFSQLYQSPELKIALEQAMFSAVFYFIQKERPDQPDLRLNKYKTYFARFLELQFGFGELIRQMLGRVPAASASKEGE